MNPNVVEEEIKDYISKNILFSKNGYPYPNDMSLLEEGIIDSMNVLELVTFVEQAFGVNVEDADIVPENFDSVSNLYRYVLRKSSQAVQKPATKSKKANGLNTAASDALS